LEPQLSDNNGSDLLNNSHQIKTERFKKILHRCKDYKEIGLIAIEFTPHHSKARVRPRTQFPAGVSTGPHRPMACGQRIPTVPEDTLMAVCEHENPEVQRTDIMWQAKCQQHVDRLRNP
jgi:hypothetical protein